MALRETLNAKPVYAMTGVGGLLLIGLVVVFFQARGPSAPVARNQEFFTVDDGKTWFKDDATKLPPFDKGGKQAVRAYVFRSAKGTEFVNHLERFKPEARRALEEAATSDPNAKGPPRNLAAIQSAYIGGREVKRPGEPKWTSAGSFREAAQVTAIKSPDGSEAVAVEP